MVFGIANRIDQDILLVRFAHSWDILVNTRNKFHIVKSGRVLVIYY